MTATTKTPVVNYTDAQVERLKEVYTATPTKGTVEALASEFGKTTRSIVAKLSRLEIYQKPVALAKDGKPVQKKNDLADAIGKVLKMTEAEISGLAASPKTALQKIFDALANSVPMTPENSPAE
jgi:hypothetical protein